MSAPALEFRIVVDEYDPTQYAPWVRALGKENGAYVIRDLESHEILYVGESHSNRLRSTLTRHFQSWSGYQAGTLYSRYRVEVALYQVGGTGREAIDAQEALIRELAPRDNVHFNHGEEDASFDPSEFQDDW